MQSDPQPARRARIERAGSRRARIGKSWVAAGTGRKPGSRPIAGCAWWSFGGTAPPVAWRGGALHARDVWDDGLAQQKNGLDAVGVGHVEGHVLGARPRVALQSIDNLL